MSTEQDPNTLDAPESIAIIGMSGRFPKARDLAEFWANLRDGVDCILDLSDADLRESGTDPASLPPGYVRSAALINGIEMFDAGFFSFSPREAEILDPQSRLFLECSWEALESAGYISESYPGWVGLYAGVSIPGYFLANLASNAELMSSLGFFHLMLSNDRDYFATRTSYKLNLRGPSVNVQTACSTSLVAVHLACQSLLSYQCTLAVAGGVRLQVPQKRGYVAQEGSIFSPDGRCRSFDAKGQGALFGEGVGVVVLKRLSEAIADGDPIHAVIRGSAFNNDGAMKVGYTAPSVEGQAEVIALAHAVAGVDPETITYVEAHGSGTPLGDPIEVAALTQAFRAGSNSREARGFCALGSVKSSVGHLEAASGIAGLVKATLALENGAIPPNLHFETPNPQIDFDSSPFFVNTKLREWPRSLPGQPPRRAGVSSFGMGGTNAHVILEEAPERAPSGPSRPWQLLPLTARTPTALEAVTDRLVEWLEKHPGEPLADVAHTLQAGRRTFAHRRALVCRDREDAIAALRSRDPRRLLGAVEENAERPVAFLLPGLGDHYPGMGLGLYRHEPAFRAALDHAAELLRSEGIDLLASLYPQGTGPEAEETPAGDGKADLRAMLGRAPEASTEGAALHRTEVAQPAVFAVEYALAKVLEEWGIRPQALAGYSLGEYVAACLAGVFSFEDALRLVARRARLIGQLPAGAMLSVALPEEAAQEVLKDLKDKDIKDSKDPKDGSKDLKDWELLSVAAVNGPALTVLSGPPAAIEAVAAVLAERGIATRRLPTTHAFHSRMMEPLSDGLRDLLRGVRLAPPEIPYLSNVTGTWITAEEATDPGFWVRHLVEPVRFGASLTELLAERSRLLVEVGPGQGLSSLALQLAGHAPDTAPVAVPALRPSYERRPDTAFLLGSLARLWLAGLPIDWAGFAQHERRNKLRLPTYPFERKRYWIESVMPTAQPAAPGPAGQTGPEAPAPASVLTARHDRPVNLRNPYVAPRDETEERLVEIWQSLLGVAPIGIHDSFFELGGQSLLAPQLLLRMHRELDVDFPMRDLFEAPTIAELAVAIEVLRTEGAAALAAARETVDLRAEVVLDPAIRAEGERVPSGDPTEVFVTGATGFFGAFLVDELVRRTNARIHCLVRATGSDPAGEAERRLRDSLASREVWRDEMEGRVTAVPGDLGEPLFGLSEEAFHDLAARVDVIYHCGTWVNFTYPYKVLKPSNVLGTIEALRLAGRVRTKPVHYVSSIAAVPEVEYGYRDDPTVYEDDDTDSLSGLFGGYGETKWVSEQLCKAARSRGIPVSIYRPGVLGGHSRTGVSNTRDMVWNMIKGCIQAGAMPSGQQFLDVTPVDYVAASLVHISLHDENLNRVFQFPHPQLPRWRAVFEFMRDYGYPVEMVDSTEWMQQILALIQSGADNALAPFAPVVANYDAYAESASAEQREGQMKIVHHDDRNTRAAIAGTHIACPALDAALLTTYFDHFIRTGFLPPPPREGAEMARRAHSRKGDPLVEA
jgi:phthiocerol/phenolphthiocerol synthesis type-I polyketide synthase E